jgi:hypothetical protein
MVKATKNQKMR